MLNGFTSNINSAQLADFSNSFKGLFLYLILYLVWCFIGMKLFRKAGKDSMTAFIPFLNIWELTGLLFGEKKKWLCLIIFVPLGNLIAYFGFHVGLAKAFGQKTLVGFLSAFFPFIFLIFCIACAFIFPPFAVFSILFYFISMFIPVFAIYYAFCPNVKYTGPVESL